ncbi:tyrosine-type recombinase/integrase [Sulfurimonas sp. SAG-AH-194-I05]|nr:tyrosine-type recombinase/integrase [Sulfurimonas sp. SAG-AH-194-I05]
MKIMVKFFGVDTIPDDITELAIEEFFEGLDVTRDTKSQYKTVLDAMFEKARKDRAISTNIVKQFSLPQNETQNTPKTVRMPFSPQEMRKLIDNADRRLRNFLGIAFHLGIRIEENLGLMIQDIKFEEGTIHLKRAVVGGVVKPITPQKGGERDVPLYEDAIQYIEDQISWAKEKNSLYLFFDGNGERLNDSEDIRGRCTDKFYWNNYLKELNIFPHRRMMNTRHSFAVQCITNMERLEISLNDIALMMGHSSIKMLISHYNDLLADKNKTINRRMSIFQESEPSTDYSTDSEILAK